MTAGDRSTAPTKTKEDLYKGIINALLNGADFDIQRRRELLSKLADIAKNIHSISMSLSPLWKDYLRVNAARKRLMDAKILPHSTTPWHLLSTVSEDNFPRTVIQYYSDEWKDVEVKLIEKIAGYTVSSSAKDSFLEALHCHGNTLYRSSTLILFPMMEAEFRRFFEIQPSRPSASLKELRHAAANLPIDVCFTDGSSLGLYQTLNEHLYRKVESIEDILEFETNPIPNRHAAIHGYINYDSELSSLNTIFLADYVMTIISRIDEYSRDTTGESP